MALGFVTRNVGYKIVAVVIAFLLWALAHGRTSQERGFDIPVVFNELPDYLVIVDQNSDVVNVRVRGTPASLRNLAGAQLEYPVDVKGVRPGKAVFEVEAGSRIELPRGANIVSRSPAALEVTFERTGSKTVRLRADLEGEPPPGFKIAGVDLEPARVRITGARSEVRRLSEVVTEAIEVRGLTKTEEREVRVSIGSDHMWVDHEGPIKATIRVESTEPQANAGNS